MPRPHIFMPTNVDQWKCSCGTLRRKKDGVYTYKQDKDPWLAPEPVCGERKLKIREPSPTRVDKRQRS